MRRDEADVGSPGGERGGWRRRLERVDPEPIIALLEPLASPARRRRIGEVLARRLESVTLVLDALHDPHNGAAVLRTCDAFGVDRLHVLERGEPFVVSGRVARGSERWVETVVHPSTAELLVALRETGYELVAAHPEGAFAPADLAAVGRLALVLGNEHAGIGPDLRAACRAEVRIPMRGFVESLNVSVSAAILLCFATAGRPGDLSPSRQRQLYARALVQSVPRALDILDARGLGLDRAARDAEPGRRGEDGGDRKRRSEPSLPD